MGPTSALWRLVVDKLRERFSEHLVAMALFGSAARGEATERSDLDFLVILRGIPKSLERRREVYKPIRDAVAGQHNQVKDITVIDVDEEFIKDEDAEITSLMLNIAADAVILYDPKGELATFLRSVHRLIEAAGLERYRTSDGSYGWKPRQGILQTVEV